MSSRSSLRRLGAALPAVLILAACAGEETAQNGLLSPANLVSPPVRQSVVLCKVGSNASFNVTFASDPSTSASLTDGECQTVVTYGGGFRQWTSIDEIVPANTTLDSIVVETVFGCTASSCTLTYDKDVLTGTTTAGVWVGLEWGAVVTYYNTYEPPPPPPGGGEGCTPGYWKQPQHFDSWTAPYTPSTLFSSVFADAFPGMTLLQVASQGGGGLKALGRHTVAALLNSASGGVDYDMDVAGVIAAFNAAYASGDYETQKNIFNFYNEQGCPLN